MDVTCFFFVVDEPFLCPKFRFFFQSYLTITFSLLQLLVSYGDSGTKGALTDEHVLGSAKCQVWFSPIP